MMHVYDHPIDRLDMLAACFRALDGLLIPSDDLHLVGREDLSAIIGLLADLTNEALEAQRLHDRRNLAE